MGTMVLSTCSIKKPWFPRRKALKAPSSNLGSTAMAVASDRVKLGRPRAMSSDEHLNMVWKAAEISV